MFGIEIAAVLAASTLLGQPPVAGQSPPPTAEVRQRWRATVDEGDVNAIAYMLDSGMVTVRTFIDNESNTALHLTAERSEAGATRFLLSRGADPDRNNGYNESPLGIANARCGLNSPVTQMLLAASRRQ